MILVHVVVGKSIKTVAEKKNDVKRSQGHKALTLFGLCLTCFERACETCL
ncbi:hypothetical protein SDC9_40898 [bioreactor metagenome]|uniref:Uncharacterized protein n=1 Tax=bioreactor metagenome TaxID=1076179 RepID=A0A644VWN7_9ZZZZ